MAVENIDQYQSNYYDTIATVYSQKDTLLITYFTTTDNIFIYSIFHEYNNISRHIFYSGDSPLKLRYFLTMGFHLMAFSRNCRFSRRFGVDPFADGEAPLSRAENTSDPKY